MRLKSIIHATLAMAAAGALSGPAVAQNLPAAPSRAGATADEPFVVGDIRMTSLEGDIRPAVFIPYTQLALPFMTLVARTEQDPLSLVATVRPIVRDPIAPSRSPMRTNWPTLASTASRPASRIV